MKKHLFLLSLLWTTTSQAHEILYIGDSHSFVKNLSAEDDKRRFGNVLIDGLKSQGHGVSYYAACGSAAGDWVTGASTECGYSSYVAGNFQSSTEAKFPGIADIYRPLKHTLLIVNLGDNMFTWKAKQGKKEAVFSTEKFLKNMNPFLAKIAGVSPATCTWIGPTYHVEGSNYIKPDHAVDELYRGLFSVLKQKCKVIDSRPLVKAVEPNDGLHHVSSDSRDWARALLGLI